MVLYENLSTLKNWHSFNQIILKYYYIVFVLPLFNFPQHRSKNSNQEKINYAQLCKKCCLEQGSTSMGRQTLRSRTDIKMQRQGLM